jgi:hypothetical protein
MHSAARAAAETLPNGQRCAPPGQSHDVSPDATAAVLEEFLSN